MLHDKEVLVHVPQLRGTLCSAARLDQGQKAAGSVL